MRLRVLVLCAATAACAHQAGGFSPDDAGVSGDDDAGAGGHDGGHRDAAMTDGGHAPSDGPNGGGGDGGGTCGTCTVPANVCTDSSHLRRYDSTPGCQGGACVFPSEIVDCPNGCSNGACQVDACTVMTCVAPAAVCSNATLRTSTASCTNGICQIEEADTTCANGCSAGACLGPTCGATTCDAPTPATCLDPKVLSGPAQLGTCSGTTCTYAPLETLCSQGCFGGACEAGSTESIFMPPVPGSTTMGWRSNVAFAVDAAGQPHLAGQDDNGNITWRHLDTAGWHDVTVDTNLANGVQVAIALDPSGSPVLAYYEPTNKRLRYAELRGTSFHVEEVSTTSPAGTNPAIAVDAAGTRWIASTDGALGLRASPTASRAADQFESLGTRATAANRSSRSTRAVRCTSCGARPSRSRIRAGSTTSRPCITPRAAPAAGRSIR